MTVTVSLCPICYRELPARLFVKGDGVWMAKTCPQHGETIAMVERDAMFWQTCQQPNAGFCHAVYDQLSLIEVTDRCNLKCRHCYHQPDNSVPDRPAAWIIAKALSAPTPEVCLMGAEPTLRDDLPEIIEGIVHGGKSPLIYTNGIRLADAARVAALRDAGLGGVSISVHDTSYHGENIHAKVLQAVENVVAAGLPLGQLSFTIADLGAGLEAALRRILDISAGGIAPVDFCLRTPAAIGQDFDDPEFFISDMVKAISALAIDRGIAFAIEPAAGNTPHHVRVRFGGIPIQLIHWPTAANIDLRFASTGPWASFIDGTFGSFALQAILRDGIKQGWWQGRRLQDQRS